MSNKAELLFMKWKADLADMDRSKPAVEGNFDLLFDQLFRSKVKMEEALPYLDKAIKAHYPTSYVVKQTFKRIKHFGKSESIQDFESSWKEHIGNAAKRVFFSIYNIDDDAQASTENKYGNMSASEYRKQQKYADSHPTIDWEAIIEERDATHDEVDIDVENVDLDFDLGEL